MADPLYRVELTASFLERLDAIEAFLVEADAAFAFDDLLVDLRAAVFPNLARFPRIGRRYLDNAPQSKVTAGRTILSIGSSANVATTRLHERSTAPQRRLIACQASSRPNSTGWCSM